MKILTIYLFLVLCAINLIGKDNMDIEEKINKLIPALIKVESNGNDNAIGDDGEAVGCLQLHKIYIDDVNRIYNTGTNLFDYKDAYNRTKSIRITGAYLKYWGQHFEKINNKKCSLEDLARIHNGGPEGYKKPETVKYWEKVQVFLKKD